MNFLIFCFVVVVLSTSQKKRFLGWTPTQIKLSYDDNLNNMVVTWISYFLGDKTVVKYGLKGTAPNMSVTGNVTVFGDELITRYVHRATMTSLQPNEEYSYFVEDATYGVSDTFTFVARGKKSMVFAVYGDFGYENAVSLPLLQSMYRQGSIDAVLHNGDFGYNLDDFAGTRGDAFFEQIQDVSANVPYLGVPGNHEQAANFTHYRAVMTMPQRAKFDSLYWSLDVGLIHFVAFDSELYYFDTRARQQQMEDWLRADLQQANRNRQQVPWIVAFGHRPLYCSSTSHSQCGTAITPQRKYLERMFCEAGVDLVIGAHTHFYERMFPVYQGTVVNSSTSDPYNSPNAPVYVVSGAAGCDEGITKFDGRVLPWAAFCHPHYGIGLLQALNDTVLTYGQFDASNGYPATPVDSMTLIRPTHTRHFACK